MKNATAVLLPALGAAAVVLSSCGIGESGISPPNDRIFFPAALAVDPAGGWLYVVNSNSDLRYNGGSLVAVDLARAAEDRARGAGAPMCPRNNYVPPDDAGPRFCCRDFIDPTILNCDERAYVEAPATVQIGSFGGAIAAQTFTRDGVMVRRLFVAVRAEPSLTFVDVTEEGGRMRLRCTGDPDAAEPAAEGNPRCEEPWRLRTGGEGESTFDLSEEPFALSLDGKLGVLLVGHLSTASALGFSEGGVSLVDVCAPATRRPRLVSATREVIAGATAHAITSLTAARPGDPASPIFGTSRFTADVAEMRLDGVPARDCGRGDAPALDPTAARVVPSGGFFASPFQTRGADLRGLVLSDDGNRAWVLHRQWELPTRNEITPPAVLLVDRRPDARGRPADRPVNSVEVCRGPTRMHLHDSGRGPRLFVNCFEAGQIYVLDPDLLTLRAVIEAGSGPSDVVFSPTDPRVAFVPGFAENTVSIVDLTPGSPTEYRVVQRIGFPRTSSTSQR